ncbi:CRE-LEM-3 protein [Aphelenchoides avenae]|nr:CRE-LEM-3 protein [Aphelenchus avenae]
MGESEERQLRLAFADPKKAVSFFCYLLIDPTMLPDDLGSCTFEQFVAAVFYVGKGKGSRPLHHLLDASRSHTTSRKLLNEVKLSEKLKRIISLWDAGRGVISLPICFNIHSDEALIRVC